MRQLKKIYLLSCCLFLLNLAGCACVDPLEPLNRQFFTFNMIVDHSVFRPVAKVYDKVMPPFVACRVSNFFDNLDDVTNVANNLLQFKLLDAWSDCWRIAFNTTFGLGGLFDVATCAGLPKHHQDFGLTLARYGFVNSTYLMIPFFGPTTIRDSIGWTVDWTYLSVWPYVRPTSLRYGLYSLRLVQKRACLLAADKLIDDAIDPYTFVRDAYLQKRECEIKSICPPCEPPPASANHSGHTDADDTFVSDGNETPGNSDPNDTFVSDDDGPKSSSSKNGYDPFVAEGDEKKPSKAKKPIAKSTGADDTFVAP